MSLAQSAFYTGSDPALDANKPAINVNQNDIGSTRPESGKQNWVIANQRTAAALKAKGFHYKFVYGLGEGHCSPNVRNATLADALMWVWRGYQPGE